MSTITRTTVLLAFAVLGSTVAGCSTFNDDWAVSCQGLDEDELILGPWIGSLSDSSGQKSPARCIVSEDEDGNYYARTRVRYALIFTGETIIPISVDDRLDGMHFNGRLKQGGDTVRYDGRVANGKFVAKLRSRYDYGRYVMRRPEPAPVP